MGSIGEEVSSDHVTTISTGALLFDFDGTIIDSTAAIVKHWHKQGKLIGVDPEVILETSHGRRSIDVFKVLCPQKANWEYVCHEERLIPLEFGNDAEEIPGARKVLEDVDAIKAPWAVVTSGTQPLVKGWLGVLKLNRPTTLVTAEDVENGKPDPSCYLLGLDRLGLAKGTDALVFEDAPSGIRAGKSAGFRVLGLATTHTVEQVQAAGADWVVRDMRDVKIKAFQEGMVQVEIKNMLHAASNKGV